MFSKKDMTLQEWHRSPEFIVLRLLNNTAANLEYKAQELNDILELVISHQPGVNCLDRFMVVERQLRIVRLEAKRLWDESRKLCDLLTPTTTDAQNTMQQPQQDQHPG